MYKEIAIIAPTASGKTALSINLAHKMNAVILSLDSLAVYKQIDIASAKPTLAERDGIVHFGIDKVLPNQKFDVIEFIQEYRCAKKYAQDNNKNLIIVGGTGFYLKSMIDGLSPFPTLSEKTKDIVKEKMYNIDDVYNELSNKDTSYMKNIASSDKYRIQKALEIFTQTNQTPSFYFENNKPTPIINNINIYEIITPVDILRDRIKLRTKQMIDTGLIDEVIFLENRYSRKPNSMKSIGIVEGLDYLDGKLTKEQLEEQIFIHTSQLAKRQRTFNKSQFSHKSQESLKNLEKKILSMV